MELLRSQNDYYRKMKKTKCNNYLYFTLYGDYFDTNIITKKLNLKPTDTKTKKDSVPKKTSWEYKIQVGDNVNLKKPLEILISTFAPLIKDINELKADLNLKSRLQFVIYIDIDPDASSPFFGFNKNTIDFLHRTGTEVDFDLYKADTIGLLK